MQVASAAMPVMSVTELQVRYFWGAFSIFPAARKLNLSCCQATSQLGNLVAYTKVAVVMVFTPCPHMPKHLSTASGPVGILEWRTSQNLRSLEFSKQ